MLKGILDTNTEEQVTRSIDVLKEVVLSTRKDVKDVNQRFDRVESDIGEIKETLREMNGRNL